MNLALIIGVLAYLGVGAYTAIACDKMHKAPNQLALLFAMIGWPVIAVLAFYFAVRTGLSGKI